MSDEQIDEIERQIHDLIRFHRQQYEKAVGPLIDKLIQLRSLRPQVLVLSRDQLDSIAIQACSPRPLPPGF